MASVWEDFASSKILFILCCIYVLFKLARFGSREKHLPPGPPTYPIVGNAHLAVDKYLYKRFGNTQFPFQDNHLTNTGLRIGLSNTAMSFLSRSAEAP